MDLTGANTESMLRYHRFHERLNRSIKMQVIGLGFLADEIDAGTPAAAIAQRATARQGLWGGMPDWNGARDDVEFAVRDVGQAGVARAFGALDLFMEQLQGELTSWRHFIGEADPTKIEEENEDEDNVEDKVNNFYERLEANRSRVEHIWPVYRYFRFARNCIVHREGVASRALVEAATDSSLTRALARWTAATGDLSVPELIDVEVGRQLDFTHRQALHASSVLRLIALDLGRFVISMLGERGFVYLVARRTFLDDTPLAAVDPKGTMVKTFNVIMKERYRVRAYDYAAAMRILRSLDLTRRCSLRFSHITNAA